MAKKTANQQFIRKIWQLKIYDQKKLNCELTVDKPVRNQQQ